MIKVNINGRELAGKLGDTILQIARAHNIDIPTMCYDERLETYGACGLCVVEIAGSPKLARACATTAGDGMVIDTMSEKVVASRKAALELLMSDHVGDCKAPCMLACPGNTDCQGYVGLIANGELEEAIKTIKDQLPMPACIGRVCPHPCETECRRGLVEDPIAIAQLKYFAADADLNSGNPYMPEIAADSGKKIAIVGGGPGGLSASFFLRQRGHAITVFDAMPKMGGMLRYGIPEYRLPKVVVDSEVAIFEKMGVKMVNNQRMGVDFKLEDLRRDYDAVILATGAWKSSPLRCNGMDLDGVLDGIGFLEQVSLGKAVSIGERVAIVGGGNTAMDACRTAVRLGAKEVYNIYRRTKDEMPAEPIELIEAEEEGVIFKYLVNPIEIVGQDGKVSSMTLQKMRLGEPDDSGRRRPVAIEGETETLEIDCVITAIGQKLNPAGHDGIELTAWGTIAADAHSFMTNLEGVFALGDATNDGADIAIAAIGDAKRATPVIDSYLTSVMVPHHEPFYSIRKDVKAEEFADMPKEARAKMPHLTPEARKVNFKEVNLGFDLEAAMAEGKRCLECGCLDVYDCDLIKYSRQYDIDPTPYEGERHHRSVENPHPYIQIDQDKCILCGQCVRTCEEVLGIGALGLVDRGFESMMQPAFNLPLVETGCISCGQCISVCPTGALQERLSMTKSVPLPPERTQTTCDKCSMGCQININTKGRQVVRVESILNSPVDDGQLCVKGRFGHQVKDKTRLVTPLILEDGKQREATWQEATTLIAETLKHYNASDIALSVGDRYSNEDLYSLKTLFVEQMGIVANTSPRAKQSPITAVTGVNGSTNSYDELISANAIVLIGTDIMRDYPVLGMRLRKALKAGAKLYTIDNRPTLAAEWAEHNYLCADDVSTLSTLLDAVGSKTDAAFSPRANHATDAQLSAIAEQIVNAKNAMFIYDGSALSDEAIKLTGLIATQSGHLGRARNGLIELTRGANNQGLRDVFYANIQTEANSAKKVQLHFGQIDNISPAAEFVVAHAVYHDDALAGANVVLPAQTFEYMSGSFTSAQRQITALNAALKDARYPALYQWLNQLAVALGYGNLHIGLADIQAKIANSTAGYHAILDCADDVVYTMANRPVVGNKPTAQGIADIYNALALDAPFKTNPSKHDQVDDVLTNYLKSERII